MDYSTQPLLFKLKKALRYVTLYGPRRTLVKVRGQYHMKKRYINLPPRHSPAPGQAHVGIIGCGNFAYSVIAYYLHKNYGRVIRGCMDKDVHKAASLFEGYHADYYTDDASEVLGDDAIDLVYIASNHASHAEYAIEALCRGKHVHVEKPHVVSEDQLVRLCLAMKGSKGSVALGFNRPHSRIGRAIRGALEAESGASLLNWFVVGHELPPDHWYLSEEEGGRVLGNLCHWTDLVYQMVSPSCRFPIVIKPTRSMRSDCDIAVTYTFGDGSIAVITFSEAKGHAFEGVKERFAAHRGDTMIFMDDFKDLVIHRGARKARFSERFRDHGHEGNVLNSYKLARGSPSAGVACSVEYVWETGQLFLKTKEALEEDRVVTLDRFDPSMIGPCAPTGAP